MKKSFFFFFLITLIFSCAHNDNKTSKEMSDKKQVIDATISYAKGKFKESKETIGRDGIITITDNQVNFVTASPFKSKYIIDPSKVALGLIDDDEDEDAIINVISVTGQDNESPENLIYIKTNGKFLLSRVIESNMKVLSIQDRVITAEVSSRSLNTPLRDCHECKEVVKYKYKTGDLIKAN